MFFFFQAEDGIRDVAVTGVQTCALPISDDGYLYHEIVELHWRIARQRGHLRAAFYLEHSNRDRKSTRLNSSHGYISYAVFCLKKKNNILIVRDNMFEISKDQSFHLDVSHDIFRPFNMRYL